MHARSRIALTTVLLAFLTAVCAPALAQGTGWYVGAGLGLSTATDACDGIAGPGITCDDEDTALKLLAGYRVNPNFAVEAGYTDLGKATATFAGLGSASFESNGFEIVAVGSGPVSPQWSLFGKVGFFRWDLDFKDGTGIVGDLSESGTDLTFGFGAHYDISRTTTLRLEYQVYSNIGDSNTTGESDVSVLGAGVLFRF